MESNTAGRRRGAAALAVSPRVGHVHVTVNDATWVWADASGEPVVVPGLPPGFHKILIQLETANHQLLDQGAVQFTVPEIPPASAPTVQLVRNETPARIIIDAPLAEPRCLAALPSFDTGRRICRPCRYSGLERSPSLRGLDTVM